MMSFSEAHDTVTRRRRMSNALPMGLEPNKSSDRTAAMGVHGLSSGSHVWRSKFETVRLSSAAGYASAGRRWFICKQGSCTIAPALQRLARARAWCRAGPGSVRVDGHPGARVPGLAR